MCMYMLLRFVADIAKAKSYFVYAKIESNVEILFCCMKQNLNSNAFASGRIIRF